MGVQRMVGVQGIGDGRHPGGGRGLGVGRYGG